MTQAELIKAFSENRGISLAEAEKSFKAFCELIEQDLLSSGTARLGSLGTLKVSYREGRQGFNPSTKEPMEISPTLGVLFSRSVSLKKKLEESTELAASLKAAKDAKNK